MRTPRSARGALLLALGLWAGCFEITPEQRARDVCTAYCDCYAQPGQTEACVVNDCLPDIPPVTDACLDCVYANSQMCGELVNQCLDLCTDTATPLLGGMQ
jgi:hypothetical protein